MAVAVQREHADGDARVVHQPEQEALVAGELSLAADHAREVPDGDAMEAQPIEHVIEAGGAEHLPVQRRLHAQIGQRALTETQQRLAN